MEHRFDLRLQVHPGHRLCDSVGHSRYSSDPTRVLLTRLRNFHRFDRRREVAPGRHAVPNAKKMLIAILLELGDRHIIHSGRTPVGLDPLIRLPYDPLGDVKRLVLLLRLVHPTPPDHVS